MRIRKDLELLELEANTRYDVAPVLKLAPVGGPPPDEDDLDEGGEV